MQSTGHMKHNAICQHKNKQKTQPFMRTQMQLKVQCTITSIKWHVNRMVCQIQLSHPWHHASEALAQKNILKVYDKQLLQESLTKIK